MRVLFSMLKVLLVLNLMRFKTRSTFNIENKTLMYRLHLYLSVAYIDTFHAKYTVQRSVHSNLVAFQIKYINRTAIYMFLLPMQILIHSYFGFIPISNN